MLMSAKLLAYTVPVSAEYGATPEEFIAYVARVSNPANRQNHATGPKLIRYLVRNQHWSPLEMANAVIEVETTRDIARQILRHRSFSFQEFSQRYSSEIEFVPPRELRRQDPVNRQNSFEGEVYVGQADAWRARQRQALDAADAAYTWALAQGIAKEVARAVLPEGLTMSRLAINGNLRSWLHYIQLRTTPGTQKEHRIVAEDCRAVLMDKFPGIMELSDSSSKEQSTNG